jgi:hypothetical protein
LDLSIRHSEAINPSYHITHHVGSIERNLKLAFGKCSLIKASHTALAVDRIDEAQRAHAIFDADESETGYASRNGSEVDQSRARGLSKPPAIVDDEPWKQYLDIRESSSGQVGADDGHGTSALQLHVPARNKTADFTSWPQRAIHGNFTPVKLSSASASLPTLKRPSGRQTDARSNMRTDGVRDVDNDERLWRSFVLGDDPQSAIDTTHTYDETSEDSMSQATKGYASTRLPLSTAVTSVNSTPLKSTPFRTLSGQASRISDDVQYAPHPGSRSIASPAPSYAVWGRIKSLDNAQGAGQGDDTPACSAFGDQAIHTSQASLLQNHASHDTELFGGTRTSRSDLDRRDRAWDDVSRRAQASGSFVWQRSRRSSTWDIPDSDDTGIDLVDPDRLT